MKSSEYWKQRFQAVEDMNNRTAQRTVQDVTPAFDKAMSQIEREINAWYARFAKNNEISLADAKRLLTSKELKELRWDVEEYIKYGRENAIDQKWMKELENASARYHISRLEALKIRTQQAAEAAFGNELDALDELAARIYTEDYYHTAFEIQKGTGIGWDIGQIDKRKLDRVLSKPWTADKLTFSDRIWKSKAQLVDSLHKELTQMCILGKAPDQSIKNIAKQMNVSKGQAGRLIMTESAYFASAAQKDCFNDLDVEKYEIIATLDSRTSDTCQQMDGKVFDMKDFQAGVTAPPFHVWCRSCTAPWFEDNNDGTRIARGADGRTYEVPANMTYEQWVKGFIKPTPLEGIRTPVDIEFDTTISGYKTVSGGHSVRSNGEKYGQEVKLVTIGKRNTTEWDELPSETRNQLQYSSMDRKPFHLAKGEYEVQRYVEGSLECAERDEIAKELGAEYIGFSFQRKNNQGVFIDFYQKGDELLYSIGKADVKKTVTEASLEAIERATIEREKFIIETIGETNLKNISTREGDEWVSAMKEFHHTIRVDGKPLILSDDEYDAITSPVLYRGIAPQSRLRSDITTTSTTKEMADEFFKGESPFPSRGVYGDGVAYASPAYREIAWNYATNGGKQLHGGVIIEFKLKSDARIITYEDALEVFRKMSKKNISKLLFDPNQAKAFDKEVGKAMNALGYDAIIKHNGDNTGQDFYVVLDRAALVTKQKYITTAL